MKNFIQSVAFKILVVIALFLTGMMVYSASTGRASIIETLSGVIVTPLQSAGASISNGFYDFAGIFTDAKQLREENEKLSEELDSLRKQQVELDELRQLNDSYEKYLELKEQNPEFQFVHSKVISSDSSEKYGNFAINKGSISGVKVNDPVISGDMLVGIVYSVGPNSALVRTIYDPATQVGAYISRNNAGGITGGSTEPVSDAQIRLNYLPKDKGPSKDDIVVTSGQGGVFPSKLLIGHVESVSTESHGTTLYAVVNPFIKTSDLDYVSVITYFTGQGE